MKALTSEGSGLSLVCLINIPFFQKERILVSGEKN